MQKKETPTKFIVALRRYREHKKQWLQEMDAMLAAEEDELRDKRKYLYHDLEAV